MPSRRVDPYRETADAVVRAAPSKSDTHRGLVAAALASGRSEIVNPLESDDTLRTVEGLRALGISVTTSASRWSVAGLGGDVPGGGTLLVGDSGTSCRFLLALAALGRSPSRLDGSARLRERPIASLVTALNGLGASVVPDAVSGGLPAVAGGVRPRGGRVEVPIDESSQFASALLLVAPALPLGLSLTLTGRPVSLPYVAMTLETMKAFGAIPRESVPGVRYAIASGGYSACDYTVEGDHSSASYFLAIPAVLGRGRVRVEGIRPDSAQADAAFTRMLESSGLVVRRGAEWVEVVADRSPRPFDVDLSQAPDLAPTLGVVAAFAQGPCTIRGLSHLRVKESDRLDSLADNLPRIGAHAKVVGDMLLIEPRRGTSPASREIATRADHRLAMAFAIAGLRVPDVVIDDDECVAKSNPGFWASLDAIVGGRTRTDSSGQP